MKYNNIFNLQGKIAVVVGGAGLLGKEIVRGLAESGATTLLVDVHKKNGMAIVRQLTGLKLDVCYMHVDIARETSIKNLIRKIDNKYGQIDCWVNSAYPKTKGWGRIGNRLSFDLCKKNIDMHLVGYLLCAQMVADYMKKKRTGSIVNMASIYGIVGPDFSLYENTQMTVPMGYAAIKGGIVNATRYFAASYGRYNIRVNCISPGGISDKQPKAFVKRYNARTPLKRMANKEDVVGGLIYLASDASQYVTGHNMVIDGGWSIV